MFECKLFVILLVDISLMSHEIYICFKKLQKFKKSKFKYLIFEYYREYTSVWRELHTQISCILVNVMMYLIDNAFVSVFYSTFCTTSYSLQI